jgi:hypothetical protein
LREGDPVMMLLNPSADRDEDVVEAPQSSDIPRDPAHHLVSGFGGTPAAP